MRCQLARLSLRVLHSAGAQHEGRNTWVSLAVIPAQAGIKCCIPRFRAALAFARLSGFTPCHKHPVLVKDFVSEQWSEAIFARKLSASSSAPPRNDRRSALHRKVLSYNPKGEEP